VTLYNFIMLNSYVELLKPSNQMSTVNCQIINLSGSYEFDVLVVLFVIFFSFSIF
jgi:hypothetical protein